MWQCFGRRPGLRAPHGVVAELERLVPAGPWQPVDAPAEAWWTVSDAGNGSLVISGEGAEPQAVAGPGRATEAARLARSAMELWAGEHADGPVVVHAGVVTVKGKALLLPGRSRTGKTTLTAALVRAGAAYYSDEFALLGRDGQVHPYRRPLAIRQQTATGETTHHVVAPGAEADRAAAAPVAWIVDCFYDPSVATLDLTPTTEPVAALALMANAVAARAQSEHVLDACTAAAAGTISFAGRRGDSTAAGEALLQLLA